MANCTSCTRSRPKREEHLSAQGLIEYKASKDAGTLMQAFGEYASLRQASQPFVAEGAKDHPNTAWPFLFHPDSIARCKGFLDYAQVDAGADTPRISGNPHES